MTAHETTPSDAAIGQAYREVSANPMLCNAAGIIERVDDRAREIEQGRGGVVELPTKPAAWGIREAIGDSLWEFCASREVAQSRAGYKDTVEPLFTAAQLLAYGEACRRMEPTSRELSACECGNDFIEIFGDDISGWWVGCKSCSRVGRHNHSKHATRAHAVSDWNSRMGNRDE